MARNKDKGDPKAYCGSIKHKVEDTVKERKLTIADAGHRSTYSDYYKKKKEKEITELDFSKGFDIMEPAIQEQRQGKKRAFTHSSSWIGNVRYNPQNQTMRVMMNNEGYGFCGVPEKVYDAWEGSPSKGEFWWRNIKDRYNCSSLMSETVEEYSQAEIREALYTNLAGEIVRKALHREEQLRAMGIPETEIFRTVVNEFSTMDDTVEPWPPKIENKDRLPTPDILQIPNTVYPPIVFPEDTTGYGFTTELHIPDTLNVTKVGGKKDKKDIIEGAEPQAKPFPEQNPVSLSLGSKVGSNPSIHGLEGFASFRKIPEFNKGFENPRHPPQTIIEAIRETISQLQQEFTWMSPEYVEKAKTIPLQNGGLGKVLLIRAAGETVTDHRAEAPPGSPESRYLRKLTATELMKMARTGHQKGADLNHLGNAYQTNGVVLDADFNEDLNQMQFVVYETDPEVLNAIANGTISAVSINGGLPRRTSVQCDDQCYVVPEGVILGENDGIAFTYVVTNPQGMTWRGQQIPPAKPGIGFTKIEFLT